MMKKATRAIAITATAPTAMPAMAPVEIDEDSVEGAEVDVGFEDKLASVPVGEVVPVVDGKLLDVAVPVGDDDAIGIVEEVGSGCRC